MNGNAGSSPLARGLHTVTDKYLTITGIIPARAGFTSKVTGPQRLSRDHPRSRGVYTWLYMDEFHLLGSSPLARGLPRHSSPR